MLHNGSRKASACQWRIWCRNKNSVIQQTFVGIARYLGTSTEWDDEWNSTFFITVLAPILLLPAFLLMPAVLLITASRGWTFTISSNGRTLSPSFYVWYSRVCLTNCASLGTPHLIDFGTHLVELIEIWNITYGPLWLVYATISNWGAAHACLFVTHTASRMCQNPLGPSGYACVKHDLYANLSGSTIRNSARHKRPVAKVLHVGQRILEWLTIWEEDNKSRNLPNKPKRSPFCCFLVWNAIYFFCAKT